MGILTSATFRGNRVGNCSLSTENDLKKAGRGSFDFCNDQNTGIHFVKWVKNSAKLGSPFAGVSAESTIKHWNGKQRQHIDVKYPDIVCSYNQSMGVADLADILISL